MSREAAFETPHGHLFGIQNFEQALGPRPLVSRLAAEQVDAGRAVFRKGVHREMRLGEWYDAGNAAWLGKDVPERVGDRRQAQLVDDPGEQRLECREVGETRGLAPA